MGAAQQLRRAWTELTGRQLHTPAGWTSASPQFGTDASGFFSCPDRRVAVGAGRYEDDGRIWSMAAANRPGSVTAKPWPKQARRGRSLARRAAERRFCS
jgi:hypothetical protein